MTSKLDKLLGSKTRVALLSKLIMNPGRRFYIRELSREMRIPYGMLYREVKNLVSLGVLTEEKRGKITLVSANEKLPFFAELRGLVIKTVGLGDLMRRTLSALKGIRYALIYGSFVSGEDVEGSDIDLLVVGSVSEDEVLKAVNRVEREIGREVNYIFWSEKEFFRRVRSGHHILAEISRNPFFMLVGDENELRRMLKSLWIESKELYAKKATNAQPNHLKSYKI
jgi:predicted nucleotidyltransferase